MDRHMGNDGDIGVLDVWSIGKSTTFSLQCFNFKMEKNIRSCFQEKLNGLKNDKLLKIRENAQCLVLVLAEYFTSLGLRLLTCKMREQAYH